MHAHTLAEAPPPLLVGRDRELATLHSHLTVTLLGHGSLVLIGGEAGVGKTALAEALCGEATGSGATILIGQCYDLTETPPYGPWIELFERYRTEGGIIPLPIAFSDDWSGHVSASQIGLFKQVYTSLLALSTQQPVVLLLEDLHWADPASLDVLRFLARQVADVPLCILATYRSDALTPRHPLYRLLPLLVREAHGARLDLRPLTERDLETLVAMRFRLDTGDTQRLLAYLHARTQGNPFFFEEICVRSRRTACCSRPMKAGGLVI